MLFRNARQAVHDAFATGLTTPDPQQKGGTRYNADNAIAHQAEAGLIIRAALEQRPHLRAACLYINAPEGTANKGDFAALKSKLWRDIMRKQPDMSLLSQGRLVAMLDYLIVDYRSRIHNPSGGGQYKSAALADIVRANEEDISALAKVAMEVLQKYDNQSLQPVWHVVNEQREKYDQAYEETARTA